MLTLRVQYILIHVLGKYIWDSKNTAHIAKHGVTRREAEYVVDHAMNPYPIPQAERKWLVRGRTEAGDYMQVIYVWESDAAIDYAEIDLLELAQDAEAIYVIHARPLTAAEKQTFRKKRRGRR